MQHACLKCRAPIPPQKGRQQPRKYCVTCRPPRNRGSASVTTLPAREPPPVQVSLESATRQRLESVRREADPEGLLVIELARQIEAGGHSGASLASLSNAYSKALAAAMKDAQPDADVIDAIFGSG